jgi:hypothetical protein
MLHALKLIRNGEAPREQREVNQEPLREGELKKSHKLSRRARQQLVASITPLCGGTYKFPCT